MQLALALGRRGLGRTWPNPAVGAVIVKDGVIVGRGWTQPGGRPHAETEALKRAGKAAQGATLYVTLEPCSHHGKTPPCADAIIKAGIARVVSALEDVNPEVAGQGYARLRERGIVVETGLGAEEAARDHAGHSRRMREGRPQVLLKLAASVRRQGGACRAQARRHHRRGRAAAGASDARRGRRHSGRHRHGAVRRSAPDLPPARHVRALAGAGHSRCQASHSAVDRDRRHRARGAGLGVRGTRARRRWPRTSCKAKGVEVFRVEAKDGRLDLPAVLKALADRGITRLMVEGGPTVAASFIAADLVDQAALFRSPNEIGPGGIDVLEGVPLTALTKSPKLKHRSPPRRSASIRWTCSSGCNSCSRASSPMWAKWSRSSRGPRGCAGSRSRAAIRWSPSPSARRSRTPACA